MVVTIEVIVRSPNRAPHSRAIFYVITYYSILSFFRPDDNDVFKQAIVEEWDNLKVEDYEDMILSMPERVAACLAVEGGRTRW